MTQPAPHGLTRETATGAAVTSLAFLGAVYIPVLGLFCLLALPVLVFYYRTRLGRGQGALVVLITALVIVAVFGGLTPDLLMVGGLLLLGFVQADLFQRRFSLEKTLAYAGATVFGTGLFGLMLYSGATGVSLPDMLSTYVARNLETSLALYRDLGIPEQRLLAIENALDRIRYVLVRILPGLAAAGILIIGWITLLAARAVMLKKKLPFPELGPLNRWQAPDMLVWGVIAGGVLLLLPLPAAKITGGNLLLVLLTVYFFQGMAIVSFYLEKKQLPLALKIALYGLLIIWWQFMLLVVVGLGFFDTWADLRRLQSEDDFPGSGGEQSQDTGSDNKNDDHRQP